MNLESQVTSLELSKKLNELGFKKDSLFYHTIAGPVYRSEMPFFIPENYSAFTASELLKKFPQFVEGYNEMKITKCYNNKFKILYECSRSSLRYEPSDENLPDACAKMLIYLIENNLMEIKK